MVKPLLALGIFIVTYCCFVAFPNKRYISAFVGAAILVLCGILSVKEAVIAVNWNVMAIFCGVLVIAEMFSQSGVPAFLAEYMVNRTKSTGWAILWVCVLTGFISSFMENVATVLIIAPIVMSICKKMDTSPVPFMVGVAVSSNLQGAATLIGDPPSMIMASYAKMSFNDFFVYNNRPGIFFAIQIGAIASFAILYLFYRRYKSKPPVITEEKVKTYIPTLIIIFLVLFLAFSSPFDPGFHFLAGTICVFWAILGLVWLFFYNRDQFKTLWKDFDWETTLFLAGTFILVGSLTHTGWVDKITILFQKMVGGSPFLAFMTIVWFSVLFSAVIDNVPYLLTMVPVTMGLATSMGLPPALLMFGLLIGASLGGNITPVGASANIVGIGYLRKRGYKTTFWDFMKIGLPFSVAAVLVSSLFVWFVWR